MGSRHQVCCAKRSNFLNHDRRIRVIGGVNPDGSRWAISEAAAIAAIEAARWSFYITQAGREIEIVVATSRHGGKYLKATGDGLHPEALLALPECR